jgi:hypothetical protein
MPASFAQPGTTLHPVTTDEFLTRHRGKAMLHIPGTPEKFAGIDTASRERVVDTLKRLAVLEAA